MPTKKTDDFETADDDGTGVQCCGCDHRWPEDDMVDGYCGFCQAALDNMHVSATAALLFAKLRSKDLQPVCGEDSLYSWRWPTLPGGDDLCTPIQATSAMQELATAGWVELRTIPFFHSGDRVAFRLVRKDK